MAQQGKANACQFREIVEEEAQEQQVEIPALSDKERFLNDHVRMETSSSEEKRMNKY